MIAKGTTHNNGVRLAQYMTTGKDGERAELWKLQGFEATDIKDAFRDVHIMAEAGKCDQPFFHVQVRNREDEKLTRQQWEMTAHRIMRINGLTGQPYAIAFHINEITGEEHMHLAVSRIDAETLKAKPLPFFKERLNRISRELEKEFELQPVKSEREGPVKYAPTRGEYEQARRLGVDIHEIRNTIRTCWEHSDNGRSFEAALAHEDLILAQGDRRGFVVIDHEGGVHALGKRILDVTTGQMNARMSDLAREDLPSVQEAQAFVSELRLERQREGTAPVWDRDRDNAAWEEAVMNAAIEHEKAERQFVEPKDTERGQVKAGGREKVWPVDPPQPEGKSPGLFNQASTDATRDDRTEDLHGAAAKVWEAWRQIDPVKHEKDFSAFHESGAPFSVRTDAQAFAAALDDKGLSFAVATKDEAARSHREAEFAKALGNYAPRFREGEIVVISEPRVEYHRAGEMIEPRRVHKIDQTLAEKFVAKLDNRSQLHGIDATLKASDERMQLRRQDKTAERLERTTSIFDHAPERARKEKAPPAIGKAASRVIGGAFNLGEQLTGLVFSAFGAAKSPEQQERDNREAERATDRSNAEAEYKINVADYTAIRQQQDTQRQQEEKQRAEERERGGRER